MSSPVFGASFPIPDSPALNTPSVQVKCIVDGYVMETVSAMRANGMSTLQVDGPCHGFKMTRIDTGSDPATMIQIGRSRKLPMYSHVEGAMGQLRTQQSTTELPISVPVYRPLPDPASLIIDDVSRPVVDKRRGGGTSLPEPCVVLLA